MSQKPWSTELVVLFYLLCKTGDRSEKQEHLIHDLLWGRVKAQKNHNDMDVVGELLSVCKQHAVALPLYLDTSEVLNLFGDEKDPFFPELESDRAKKLWQTAKHKKQSLTATKDADTILEILNLRRSVIDCALENLDPESDEVEAKTADGPELRNVPNADAQYISKLCSVRPFQIAFDQLPQIISSLCIMLENYLLAVKSGDTVWDTEQRNQAKYRWADQQEILGKVLADLHRYPRLWVRHGDLVHDLQQSKQPTDCFHLIEDLLLLEQEKFCRIHEIRNYEGVLDFWIEICDPKSNLEQVRRYGDLLTDFEDRRIWRVNAKEQGSGFQQNAFVWILWRTLLENVGKPQSKQELGASMIKAQPDKMTPPDVEKDVLDNLVDKLKSVSGKPRKSVLGWFERGEDMLTLKNLG